MFRFTFKTALKDKFAVFLGHIDGAISRTDRKSVRDYLKTETADTANRVYGLLVASTPSREAENAEIYNFREKAWGKYGEQQYLYKRSPYSSIRQYGMKLVDGWRLPKVTFRGSTKTTVRETVTYENIAPQAEMVLLGKYSKGEWPVPYDSAGMYGGRKCLMWQGPDGKPRFRWMVVSNSTNYARRHGHASTTGQGPIVKANPPLSLPITTATNALNDDKFILKSKVIRMFKQYFSEIE